ncbi:MAG: GNAT superfamily N-acetyltransferase [Candidatus Azotimanducaceae bacterium]|jgi:GNAT superfamily N-acetyltransferase
MITLKEAITKNEMRDFVKFPFSLYKNNKYWVPPIIKDEVDGFDKNINPVFKHAKAHYFLAYRDNKIVGRVAAIMNKTEIEEQKISKMRFGWFDVIDDVQVSKVLLNKVAEIGKLNDLEFVEGPVGFSNLDKVGVLIDGFDHLGTMITWYNHPYYMKHLEELGYVKAKEWLEHYMHLKNLNPDDFSRVANMVQKRYQLHSMNFTKTEQILPYVDKMFDLFNASYANLSSFVPISDEQKAYFKKKYISLINPEYIEYIADKDDNLVAFAVSMPSFSKALQKANGKLFPFGFYHLLKAKKQSKEVILYLIGVHPDYQKKGAAALIFDAFHKTYTKRGVDKIFRTPELEENQAINNIFRNFQPVNHKRRRTYRKDL